MFSEISIYQVKPSEVDTFEAIMQEATEAMKVMEGAMFFRLMKRTHYIKEMSTIKEGRIPDPLTRVIKCVKYAHYWEFDTEENYGKAQKRLYESYWKAMEKCLIVPHDKLLGEVVG
ncbi:hypothetical protein IGI84_001404 [Enterococcus sp. DIV0008]|uniref:hypothetical protein n=1 Tax=Enterococcus TaxID=1350 RepID=UPI0014829735|nr:hypothetical protein [Enterococcus innesii]